MTHDTRRYHRRRLPGARAYGMLGALGGALEGAGSAIGTGVADAAGAVGTGLESAATAAAPVLGKLTGGLLGDAQGAAGGLGSIGQGLQSLFGGGGSEAEHLAALGQTVPQGVDLVGPSSTFTGPGFMGGLMQGFVAPQHYANASAGTMLGQGLGQLVDALQQSGGGPAKMPPIVPSAPPTRRIQVIPSQQATPATGPIMSLLKPLSSL